MKTNMFLNQQGQSLLEVAVSLGLILIIITVLTITTITSLKNSQFAKNQVLASSYAEEGIELVKTMRQRDCKLTITQTSSCSNQIGNYYWSDSTKGTLIWNESLQNPICEGNPFVFAVNTNQSPLICEVKQDSSTAKGEILNQLFNRKIKLERLNGNSNIIRVTVDVSWEDFSGQHNTQNVSLITNY